MKNRNSGFTLIELLAAVTILLIIVWMMATIFTETNRAWNVGTGRAANNTEGRAALQMITHDLEYAVADELLTFHMGPDRYGISPFGFDSDEICAVSIQHDSSDGNRAAREVHYYLKQTTNTVSTYQLQRGYFAGSIISNAAEHCYWNRDWWRTTSQGGAGRPPSQIIAENVVALAFYCPDPADPQQMIREYDSATIVNRDMLPPYVDVLLEVLNEREAAQAEQMVDAGLPDETVKEFIEKNLRRHSTRVYFQNRHGYRSRFECSWCVE